MKECISKGSPVPLHFHLHMGPTSHSSSSPASASHALRWSGGEQATARVSFPGDTPHPRPPRAALRPPPPAVPLQSPAPDPDAPPRRLQLRVGAGLVRVWVSGGRSRDTPPPPPQGLAPEGPSSRGSPHPPPLRGKRLPSLLLETTPLRNLVRFPDFPGCLEQSAGLGMSCFGGVHI
jgi:hypothetical protein